MLSKIPVEWGMWKTKYSSVTTSTKTANKILCKFNKWNLWMLIIISFLTNNTVLIWASHDYTLTKTINLWPMYCFNIQMLLFNWQIICLADHGLGWSSPSMKLNRNFPRGGAGFSPGGSGYFLHLPTLLSLNIPIHVAFHLVSSCWGFKVGFH